MKQDKDVLEWLTNEELDGSDFVITSFSRNPIEVKLSLDKTTNIVSARSVYDTDGNLMIPNVRTDTLHQWICIDDKILSKNIWNAQFGKPAEQISVGDEVLFYSDDDDSDSLTFGEVTEVDPKGKLLTVAPTDRHTHRMLDVSTAYWMEVDIDCIYHLWHFDKIDIKSGLYVMNDPEEASLQFVSVWYENSKVKAVKVSVEDLGSKLNDKPTMQFKYLFLKPYELKELFQQNVLSEVVEPARYIIESFR